MGFYKFLFCLAAMLLAAIGSSAQEILWETGMNYRFDNREYKDLRVAESETLYGSRITPQLGVAWNDANSLMLGVNLMSDFGHRTFYTKPTFLAYYTYDNGRFDLTAGVFPRAKITGEYSYAFFSDSVRFYDADIEGLLLHHKGRNFNFEIGCDWNSMYSADRREKFMVFSAAKYTLGAFYAGYSFDMYHHAGSYTLGGVVDNVLVSPYVGLDLARVTGMDVADVKVAWVQTFQNDRTYVGEYVKPGGMQLDLNLSYWRLGVSNNLYLGDNLFPYWHWPYEDENGTEYAYHLYYGDPYYKTSSGVYDRLELYWEPKIIDDVKVRISSIHHYDGHAWGWQQAVTLRLNLGGRLFGRR